MMDEFVKQFKAMNHFDRNNGFEFDIIKPGEVVYHMSVKTQHMSSPMAAHGGSVAGFMDCVLGLPALTLAVSQGSLTSTVEFKMNYLKPVREHDQLTGHGRVVSAGKTLIITQAEIKNQNGVLVAIGQGTFNIYPKDKREDLHAN